MYHVRCVKQWNSETWLTEVQCHKRSASFDKERNEIEISYFSDINLIKEASVKYHTNKNTITHFSSDFDNLRA